MFLHGIISLKKMPPLRFLLLLSLLPSILNAQKARMNSPEFTWLCLGDSYTIGEGVDEADRFPNQAVVLLHSKGIFFQKPRIIATTGWTTDELRAAMEKENIRVQFDFVTLLIGVNNQYRGRSAENYREEFAGLLDRAIQFTGGQTDRVIVLSIPDWGVTAFAEGRDRKKIAEEIDAFNRVNEQESRARKVHYLNITPSTRKHAAWVVSDGLHPDEKEYAVWASEVSKVISSVVNRK